MSLFILLPPVAFLVLLAAAWLQFKSMAIFSAGEAWPDAAGKTKPYACGEDYGDHRVQPDYAQFFPFAFFFTIMHVVALVVATAPARSMPSSIFALCYLIGAATGLFILFRR